MKMRKRRNKGETTSFNQKIVMKVNRANLVMEVNRVNLVMKANQVTISNQKIVTQNRMPRRRV